MSLPDGFTLFHSVGLVLLFMGNLLHIVGLATPGWTTGTIYFKSSSGSSYTQYSGTYNIGLWKICYIECVDITDLNTKSSVLDTWRAAEAFAILGMIFGLVAMAAAFVYFLTKLLKRNTLDFLQLITLIASISSLVLIIISIACYGGGVHNEIEGVTDKSIGYSLILSIIGGIIIMVAGAVFFFPSRKSF